MSRSAKVSLWGLFWALWIGVLVIAIRLVVMGEEAAIAGGYILVGLGFPAGPAVFLAAIGMINLLGIMAGTDLLTPLVGDLLVLGCVLIGFVQWALVCRWSLRSGAAPPKASH